MSTENTQGIKSDTALASNNSKADFYSITSSSDYVNRLLSAANTEAAKLNKTPCEVIKSLELYTEAFKNKSAYIQGSLVAVPNIFYKQLKVRLDRTVDVLARCIKNGGEAVKSLTRLDEVPISALENIYEKFMENASKGPQLSADKVELKSSMSYETKAITILPKMSGGFSGIYLKLSGRAVVDDTATVELDLNTKKLHLSNLVFIYTVNGNLQATLTLRNLDLEFNIVDITDPTALGEGKEYKLKISKVLNSNFDFYCFFNNVSYITAVDYLQKQGEPVRTFYSWPDAVASVSSTFSDFPIAASSNWTNLINHIIPVTVKTKMVNAETGQYTGKYTVSYSRIYSSIYYNLMDSNLASLQAKMATLTFALPEDKEAHFIVSTTPLNGGTDKVATTISTDINFVKFIASLYCLYVFLGETPPKILYEKFPSIRTHGVNLSYNTSTNTISGLTLTKPVKSTTNIDNMVQLNKGLELLHNIIFSVVYQSFMGGGVNMEVKESSITGKIVRSEVNNLLRNKCSDAQVADISSAEIASPEYDTEFKKAYPEEVAKKEAEQQQKIKEDAEKQEYLTNARNKVDTLQYGTIMQNPATTFSSRMEQLDVTGSYDVNKMEHNEYEYEGTLCIKEKIDSPASIRIYSENKESAGPARTIESIYVDCFLLQGVQEVDEEKYSIFQSLNGDTLVQFFGRRPTTLNLSGILYDTKNQQWYNDFKYWYDNYLRGSAALKNDSRIVLVYTDQIIEGFILSMSMQKQATMNVSVTVNFTMLVVSHTQLATEWTDPEHSEHIRGDRHCGHMIDEAYAEHEKNKAKLDSLSGLNFELLADASPDKGNYYDNYLKSNTKLGSIVEYSSGSSLSSIAFSSKLADVKLNMGVSEVSSDVIAAANSNQNAGLAIGSSGISMDSLKLKLNNAEDYARSYRTSQEKSAMDQINFRLSKS